MEHQASSKWWKGLGYHLENGLVQQQAQLTVAHNH
jgi:hypothetical protein